MSLRIIAASNKTQSDWDSYVAAHADASPYHSSAWLRSVVNGYGHRDASVIAYENDKIVGVFPLISMPLPFGKERFVSLPFCDMGYPLVNSPDIATKLIAHVHGTATQSKASVCEIRDYLRELPVEDKTKETLDSVSSVNQKVSMLLTLPDDKEALFGSFKSKLRSQVRKAEKNGLTSELGNSPALIDEFYDVFAKNMHKLGSPVHSKSWFDALAKEYGDNLTVGVVRSEGQCIGAGIVLSVGDKVAIPWASTLSAFNRLSPNMMLYWNFLAKACDSGKKQFDFGRSTFGEGTYKFKQQWGAQPRPLQWYDLLSESVSDGDAEEQEGEASKLRNMVEKIWTRLPLSLTKILGPVVRKHISL